MASRCIFSPSSLYDAHGFQISFDVSAALGMHAYRKLAIDGPKQDLADGNAFRFLGLLELVFVALYRSLVLAV